MKRLFFGKPSYENGTWHWGDKGLLSKEFKFTREQKPSNRTFKGKVYILTDGMCMSSCSDFAAIMQANKKAVIIGEETGGGYQGNTSGLIPSESLPCGLVIDVPLLKYTNHVEEGKNIGRGTLPQIELTPSFEELNEDIKYLERIIDEISGGAPQK